MTRGMNVGYETSQAFVTRSSPFYNSSCKFFDRPRNVKSTNSGRHIGVILWQFLIHSSSRDDHPWKLCTTNCCFFLTHNIVHVVLAPPMSQYQAIVFAWSFFHPGNCSLRNSWFDVRRDTSYLPRATICTLSHHVHLYRPWSWETLIRTRLDGSSAERCTREHIREWTVEETVEMPVPKIQERIGETEYMQKVVEQVTEVPRTSSRDRTLHAVYGGTDSRCSRAGNGETVDGSAGDRFPRQNQAADCGADRWRSSPAGCGGTGRRLQGFLHRIQQRAMEQTTPAISLVEMIVEMLVARTPQKTQQLVNTHVQHVVNTVEVERPKLVKETVQEKINQVTKHIKIPQVTCSLMCNDRYPWPRQCRKQRRFRHCSTSTESLTSLLWRRDRFPQWSRLFRRPLRFNSCSVLTKWSKSLLCWSRRFHSCCRTCKLQRCMSWRRQLRTHSCRSLLRIQLMTPLQQHSTEAHSSTTITAASKQCNKEKKEEKGQGEREKGRKDEGRRDQEGRRKEKEREPEVKKDVTDWIVVTRNRRQRKMIQIFVRVNGSKATPMEVNLTDDSVEDVMRRIQNDEDAYVTLHGRVLKRGEKLKSCEVIDGCTIQVTKR